MALTEKYKAYLQSPEWVQLKLDLLMERGCKCEKCGRAKEPQRLQVHHLTYERIYKELATDLRLLCGSCHLKVHGLNKQGKPKRAKKKKAKKEKPKKSWRSKFGAIDKKLQAQWNRSPYTRT